MGWMGRTPVSLISIIVQLCLLHVLSADDHVRQVQEELRKRHLFSGEANGRTSPALTAAVARYQRIKGFVRSGMIDSETRASLGIVDPPPSIASTPQVFDSADGARGANGERLPISLSSLAVTDERAVQVDQAMFEPDHAAIGRAEPAVDNPTPKRTRPRRQTANRVRSAVRARHSNPLSLAFQTIDRAMKHLRGDASPKRKHATARGL